MLCAMRWSIFLFFAGMVVAMTVVVYLFYPETKGLPIEEAPHVFATHWCACLGPHTCMWLASPSSTRFTVQQYSQDRQLLLRTAYGESKSGCDMHGAESGVARAARGASKAMFAQSQPCISCHVCSKA